MNAPACFKQHRIPTLSPIDTVAAGQVNTTIAAPISYGLRLRDTGATRLQFPAFSSAARWRCYRRRTDIDHAERGDVAARYRVRGLLDILRASGATGIYKSVQRRPIRAGPAAIGRQVQPWAHHKRSLSRQPIRGVARRQRRCTASAGAENVRATRGSPAMTGAVARSGRVFFANPRFA